MPSGRVVATAPVTAGVSARADHYGARRGPWPVTAGGRGAPGSLPMKLKGEKSEQPACCTRVERRLCEVGRERAGLSRG